MTAILERAVETELSAAIGSIRLALNALDYKDERSARRDLARAIEHLESAQRLNSTGHEQEESPDSL